MIVDCRFSLERICWALNRTPSFSPIIGPLRASIHEPLEYLDLLRTLTLMAAGGIAPSPAGAGYRLRQFVGDPLDEDPTGDCTELVHHYHTFWRTFAPLSAFAAARTTLRSEIDCQHNRRSEGLPNVPDGDMETETFLHELLSRRNSWQKVQATGRGAPSNRSDDGESR